MPSKHKRLYVIILIVLLSLFAAKTYYDTNSIEVKHYQIGNSSLGEVLNGIKVAHLSDLHTKTINLKEDKILGILKEEKPDLIFVTGDFISFKGSYEPSISFLRQLNPSLGIYAILGNTEYSNENGSCTLCHEDRSKSLKKKQNPIFLRNSFIPLKINGKILNIIGVDDPVDKRSDLKTALKNVISGDPSILLAHSPEIFEEASGLGIDFLLCGHNHGGQIFLTKYLRKIFPLEASLEFLEGFFQKGKTLMYVSRGIGTSYLPFRFGIKPEITFFTFLNSRNNPTNPTNSPTAPQHVNTAAHPLWSISNTLPRTIFTGFNFTNLIETFNILKIFDSLGLTSAPQHPDTATPQHRITAAQRILFDFESESELEKLNWECHKWFEITRKNVTSGKHSLKMTLPPGRYPGIDFQGLKKDWSKGNYLKMDIFNPGEEGLKLHIRIDDNQSGWEYADRFDIKFVLRTGMNPISIPTDSIRTNIGSKPLHLAEIKRLMVFVTNNLRKRELYIDNIRLE